MNFKTITLSQTNCYLLKAKDGYLLIDCGNAYDTKVFLSSISKLGIAPTDIHYLFLTHHHSDHCGLLNFLMSANPKIRVIMSKKCAEYLKTGTHYKHNNERYSNSALRLIIGTYSRLNKKWSESFEPFFIRTEDMIVEYDNDTLLSLLGIKGMILITPGHTEDSISIVTGKAAFVGDAARNMLNITGTPYQPLLLYDLEACYRSWDKLIKVGAKKIYPAHGKPFDIQRLIVTGTVINH